MHKSIQALSLSAALLFGGSAFAGEQPHMKAALVALDQALADLQKATDDKGGHKAKAIKLAKEAREQVEKGIAFDDTHSGKMEGKKRK